MLSVDEVKALREAGFTPEQIMEYNKMSGAPPATEPEPVPPGQTEPAAVPDPMVAINEAMFT